MPELLSDERFEEIRNGSPFGWGEIYQAIIAERESRKKAEEENERLRKALEVYADRGSWVCGTFRGSSDYADPRDTAIEALEQKERQDGE